MTGVNDILDILSFSKKHLTFNEALSLSQQIATDAEERRRDGFAREASEERIFAQDLIDACKKIRRHFRIELFSHAIWCNYQHPSCKKCNCGLADMLSALEDIGE